jgi:hypothetical protein
MNENESRLDLVDRVIKMAELALQAREKCNDLYDELVWGIRKIQHPPLVVDFRTELNNEKPERMK